MQTPAEQADGHDNKRPDVYPARFCLVCGRVVCCPVSSGVIGLASLPEGRAGRGTRQGANEGPIRSSTAYLLRR